VSLPGMIANSSLDPESVGLVRDYVNELLSCVTSFTCRVNKLIACNRWMVKERARIFQAEYENTNLQYQNISRS
jgi:mortality factor 4-like protein 1